MILTMNKETRLNLRITEAFREEIEALAAYHGLSMSSYVHSLLTKALRRERESTPEAFNATPFLAPVVARIAPANERRDAQRMIDEADSALKTGMPLSKTGSAITADKMTTKHKRRTG